MLPRIVALVAVLPLLYVIAFPVTHPELLFSVLLIPWAMTFIYWGIALVYRLLFHRDPKVWTDDYDIRIITTGKNPDVIRATVASCPKPPMIVSRRELDIPGTVVVPDNTGLLAKFKGEAQEWARTTFPRTSGYTLYIDEDSVLPPNFKMPALGGIIQFEESPVADNLLIEAIEAHRSGFAMEMPFFKLLSTPLYQWGGALAIEANLENETTWNRKTICEDSAFAYSVRTAINYTYTRLQIHNQAPSTLFDLIKQRRRWVSGTFADIHLCPSIPLRWMMIFRAWSWAFTIPISIAALLVSGLSWPFWGPFVMTCTLSLIGSRVMKLPWHRAILAVLLAPIASVLNAVGCLWAMISPVGGFDVTPKRAHIS